MNQNFRLFSVPENNIFSENGNPNLDVRVGVQESKKFDNKNKKSGMSSQNIILRLWHKNCAQLKIENMFMFGKG